MIEIVVYVAIILIVQHLYVVIVVVVYVSVISMVQRRIVIVAAFFIVVVNVAVISMVQRRSSMDAYFKKLRCLVKTKNIQRIEKLDEDARTDMEQLVLRIKSQRPRRVYHDSHER